MKMALAMKLTILLFAFSLSACATAHKVNIDAIEANKHKTFTIGIIKVTGKPTPFEDVDKKITVLQKVPIKEICDVLFANYGINVNSDFNRTIKVVDERLENYPHSKGENPYWGNKEYKKPGFLSGMLMGGGRTIIDEDIGNTVDITYSFRSGVGLPWALKNKFYYEIAIKSDAEVLVLHKGIVGIVDIPWKGHILDPQAISEFIWNGVNSHVGKIPEALARDVRTMK